MASSNKLDYSRLLDDEFLNRVPERAPGRASAASKGAGKVLASTDPVDWSWSHCSVFIYGAAMAAAVLVSIIFTVLLVHAHQQGVETLRTLGLPLAQRLVNDSNATSPFAIDGNATAHNQGVQENLLQGHGPVDGYEVHDHGGSHEGHDHNGSLDSHDQDDSHEGHYHDDSHEGYDHDDSHEGHDHDDSHDGHDHDDSHEGHDHSLHGAVDETEHHIAMSGGFEKGAEDDHDHLQGMHEHASPGDVVLEDHHIVPAGEPEVTDHTLLFCLPQGATDNASATPSTPDVLPVHLSRGQLDVVHSVAEYLADKAQCYLVVLQGVNGNSSVTNATSEAARGNATRLGGFHIRARCGASPGDDADDEGSAELGGRLVLGSGRSLPVVLWQARTLFSSSPLTRVWNRLQQHNARGSSSLAGPDLLDLAARLQLLWQYGGVTVDLHSSADRVLKVLSAFDSSDTSHVYLETSRATLMVGPHSCSSVIFDLITAIVKQAGAGTSSKELAPDEIGDIAVFDEVLNTYCRSKGRDIRSLPEDKPHNTTSPTPEAEDGNQTTTQSPGIKPKPEITRATFDMLRAGPKPITTTPEPVDIRVDKTLCKGNLIAISL